MDSTKKKEQLIRVLKNERDIVDPRWMWLLNAFSGKMQRLR
jgi:hypothetical protein